LDERIDRGGLAEGGEEVLARLEGGATQQGRSLSLRLPGVFDLDEKARVVVGLQQVAQMPGARRGDDVRLTVTLGARFFEAKAEAKWGRTGYRARPAPVAALRGEGGQLLRLALHRAVAAPQGMEPLIVNALECSRGLAALRPCRHCFQWRRTGGGAHEV